MSLIRPSNAFSLNSVMGICPLDGIGTSRGQPQLSTICSAANGQDGGGGDGKGPPKDPDAGSTFSTEQSGVLQHSKPTVRAPQFSDSSHEAGLNYEVEVHATTHINFDSFEERLVSLICDRKLVSFGEEHDLDKDQSFSEVLDIKDLIFACYQDHRRDLNTGLGHYINNLDTSSHLDRFLNVFKKLTSASVEDLQRHHTSRLFALRVLPLCAKLGFTDVIFEGLFEDNLYGTINRCKDKIGMLLCIFFATLNGLRIHGAVGNHPLGFGVDTAKAFKAKVAEILGRDPNSRIITKSGGLHSMTKPLEGIYKMPFGLEIDLSELSFAKDYQASFGNDYISIDLVQPLTNIEEHALHYGDFKELAQSGSIVEVRHSNNQIAFVFSL